MRGLGSCMATANDDDSRLDRCVFHVKPLFAEAERPEYLAEDMFHADPPSYPVEFVRCMTQLFRAVLGDGRTKVPAALPHPRKRLFNGDTLSGVCQYPIATYLVSKPGS